MSAIFGVVSWDGHPIDAGSTEGLCRRLQHRGETTPKLWQGGSVALGHCLLATTPEAEAETLPGYWPEEGVAITADARLDNRDELLRAFGVPATGSRGISDSDLIVRAYLKWGGACAEKLLGDFAFAIWDERKRELICVRDHFGVKPLFYVQNDRTLIFASEINALLEFVPAGEARVNYDKLGSFLTGMIVDEEATFYKGIHRVLPAQVATWRQAVRRTRKYYEFAAQEIRYQRDEEYAEHFREVFTRSVARRVRNRLPIGCMLSGGLDSSAVACVAERLRTAGACAERIRTFNNFYPDSPSCDESVYVQAVLDEGDFEPHFHAVGTARTMPDLEKLIAMLGEPTTGLGTFANDPIYPQVRAAGLNTVLDGHGGDEVVSDVPAILRELAEENRWYALAREWIFITKSRGEPTFRPLKDFILSYGAAARWRRKLRIRHRLGRDWRRHDTTGQRPRWAVHLDPRFLTDSDLPNRRTRWLPARPEGTLSAQLSHQRRVFSSGQGTAFETLDRMAGRSGVEGRYPFWDKEVVEFCLAIPPAQKLLNGRDRSVLRRGLAGVLPEQVRLRRVKTSFAEQAVKGVVSLGENNLKLLLHEEQHFGKPLIDKSWYEEAVTRLYKKKAYDDIPKIWFAISALIWLRLNRQAQASAVSG